MTFNGNYEDITIKSFFLDLHKTLLFINYFLKMSCYLSAGLAGFKTYSTQLVPDGKYSLKIGLLS